MSELAQGARAAADAAMGNPAAAGQGARHDRPAEDLLEVPHLHQLALELTTSCNLGCVYCHFAPPSRRGNDAPARLIDNVVDFVRSFPVDHVTLGGDAEVTMYKGWHEVANRLLDAGAKLRTVSNFSRGVFADEEVETFSRFMEILVSLDTSDAAKLKKIRYRADLRTITCNVQLVRARAIERGRPIPHFVCNVVVHDKNALESDRTAAFAAANGFDQINFLRYVELAEVSGGVNELFDNPNAMQVYPASTLSPVEAAHAIQGFQRASKICDGRLVMNLRPDVIDELRAVLLPEDMEARKRAQVGPGQTRTKACLMPWDYLHVRWDGSIPPCCIVKGTEAESVADKPLTGAINSANLKDWRRSLLSGELKPECADCTYVPDTDTKTLEAYVRTYMKTPTPQ